MINKPLKRPIILTTLILAATLASPLHAEKTRAEAKAEALAKIDERYNIKEAKASVRLKQKRELEALRRQQKIDLLNVELSATKK